MITIKRVNRTAFRLCRERLQIKEKKPLLHPKQGFVGAELMLACMPTKRCRAWKEALFGRKSR